MATDIAQPIPDQPWVQTLLMGIDGDVSPAYPDPGEQVWVLMVIDDFNGDQQYVVGGLANVTAPAEGTVNITGPLNCISGSCTPGDPIEGITITDN
ncbi:MAG: hypothetical protein WA676_00415 [Candidatus Sulfotelmatobacter sp.]